MTASIASRLAAHGFKLTRTGGECTAYERNVGGIDEHIIRASFPSAPENLSDEVLIGTNVYDADEMEYTEGRTMADVLAALENPSEKPYLLSFRLFLGLHKAANV